jgi:hypothetical protein
MLFPGAWGAMSSSDVIVGQYRVGFFDLIGEQVVGYTVFSQFEADNISCAVILFTYAVASLEKFKSERLF